MAELKSALTWQVNRLRCMTPAEVVYRLWRTGTSFLEKLLPLRRPVPSARLDAPVAPWLPAQADLRADRYLEAAKSIRAGRLTILSMADFDYGISPRWNRHPATGFEWPLQRGLHLRLKDESRGDIKYLWEPNRHLHLVTLAQAYLLTADAAHAHALLRLLDSWLEQCPYPLGPNWASAMEAALRLINWSLCWQMLGGADSGFFADEAGTLLRTRWLESVYRHMIFIRRNLSLHSSANNHLIGELAGLFIAGRTWPFWDEVRCWSATAQRRLAGECLKQNSSDGVNLEQATSYHLFVVEYLLIAGVCARAGAVDFPPAYWQRMEAMFEYLHFLGTFGAAMPAIGDSDDAAVVRLCPAAEFDARRALLACAAVLFQRRHFADAAGGLDEYAAWLFGAAAQARFASALAAEPARRTRTDFAAGGYCGLGMALPGRLRALFDTGPLGYTGIAAHGHADALAVLLWLDRHPFLVDAGTYCYNDQPAWRAYFRGTAAHNTVRIDGLDQSVQGGTFMWLRKAAAWRLQSAGTEECETARAAHDGYRRLRDPVTHERLVELSHGASRLLVTDTVHCRQDHLMEIFWHFAEDVQVMLEGNALTARGATGTLHVAMTAGDGEWQLSRGQEEPPSGWRSSRFGTKFPVTTAVWRAGVGKTTQFKTAFALVLPTSADGPH